MRTNWNSAWEVARTLFCKLTRFWLNKQDFCLKGNRINLYRILITRTPGSFIFHQTLVDPTKFCLEIVILLLRDVALFHLRLGSRKAESQDRMSSAHASFQIHRWKFIRVARPVAVRRPSCCRLAPSRLSAHRLSLKIATRRDEETRLIADGRRRRRR